MQDFGIDLQDSLSAAGDAGRAGDILVSRGPGITPVWCKPSSLMKNKRNKGTSGLVWFLLGAMLTPLLFFTIMAAVFAANVASDYVRAHGSSETHEHSFTPTVVFLGQPISVTQSVVFSNTSTGEGVPYIPLMPPDGASPKKKG